MNIENYLDLIVGSSFIKEKKVLNDIVEIEYFSSYEEYKALNTKSLVSKEDFYNYFYTGDKISKIIVGEPARILRTYTVISAVNITINGIKYSITREALNSLLDFPIEELSVEDGSWINRFADEYIYNKINRKIFVEHLENFTKDLLVLKADNKKLTLNETISYMSSEINKGNMKINKSGNIEYCSNGNTEQERKESKIILFLIQGAFRALGERIMNYALDGKIIDHINDFFE